MLRSLDDKYDGEYIPYYQKMQHQISVIGKETKKATQKKKFGRMKENGQEIVIKGENENLTQSEY